jgi:hypothetical protein
MNDNKRKVEETLFKSNKKPKSGQKDKAKNPKVITALLLDSSLYVKMPEEDFLEALNKGIQIQKADIKIMKKKKMYIQID